MAAGACAFESSGGAARSSAWLLAAVLAPNLALLACGQFLFLQRAWFNIDYVLLALAALALRLRPGWLAVMAASIFIVDVLFAFAPAYHFTPSSLLDSATSVFELGIGIVALNAAILVAAASLAAWSMSTAIGRVTRPLPAILTVAVFGILVVALDQTISKSVVRVGRHAATVPNLGFSTAHNAAVAIRTSTTASAGAPVALDTVSAADEIRALIERGASRPPLLFLVNVESLGLFDSRSLNEYQLAPLLALDELPDWQVSIDRVPFEGFTVAGELRELCDIRYPTVAPVLDESIAANCLPKQLNALGYETAAFHGFQGTFFQRNRWYRELGFDQVHFGGGMQERFGDLQRCGSAFEGVCDRSAWRAIVRYANAAPRPAFIYWMTLSAHLPVLRHENPPEMDACPAKPADAGRSTICRHIGWHLKLFQALADDLRSGALDGARLILVGDHSPPFLEARRRGRYSQTHVPVVDIRHTGAHATDGRR